MAVLAILAAIAAGAIAGYWLAIRRLTHRVEAMHAAMVASRIDTSPTRAATADRHLAGWRAAARPHLPHRRAAA